MEKKYYIAKSADVIGDVRLKEEVSIWYHATVRADGDSITIAEGSNIQDNCVLHVDKGYPISIGKNVTIGHGAIVHGCSIGDHTVIGMGAILLNGSQIGKNCIVGAGTLITQGMHIPDGSVVLGNPGRITRQLRVEEEKRNLENAIEYRNLAKQELVEYTIS